MNDLLSGLLASWRKAPFFAPEGTESGAGGDASDGGEKGTDGNGEGGEGEKPGTSSEGGKTVLSGKENEGGAGGDGADAGDKPDGEGEPDPRDAVPEDGKYEFNLEEGTFELSEDARTAYSQAFKEAGLTQKQADVVVSAHTSLLQSMSTAADEEFNGTLETWLNEAKTDKELGGDWNATLALANRALSTFGNDAFVKQLDNTGLGNHPDVIRFMRNVGQAIAEDKFTSGEATSDTPPTETRWYGDTTPQKKKG